MSLSPTSPSATLQNSFPIHFAPSGPASAPLMIVGEAPSEKDAEKRLPFLGGSGWMLDECLKATGLTRSQAFLTNVLREVPKAGELDAYVALKKKDRTPQHRDVLGLPVLPSVAFGRDLLLQEIALVQPAVIFACGNLAWWALTGRWGVRKWRGSVIQVEVAGVLVKVIAGLHPGAVVREYSQKVAFIRDLHRVRQELEKGRAYGRPPRDYTVRPTYEVAVAWLIDLLAKLDTSPTPVSVAADIETRAGHHACVGFATSKTRAICIPWMCVERPDGYWELEEEFQLVLLSNRIMRHPNVRLIWQNGAYDHQYEHRYHGIIPRLGSDTMVTQHAIYSVSPKSLDYLASIYCEHYVYWKDDGKEWDPSMPEDQVWTYNCDDTTNTFEVDESQQAYIAALTPSWPKLPEVLAFQHRIQPIFVKMMLRGVRSDATARVQMRKELNEAIAHLKARLKHLVGFDLDPASPKQMVETFYGTFAQTPIYAKGPGNTRGNPTCDEDALHTIAAREPILRTVVDIILAIRSSEKFLSTYVEMRPDVDGRYRSSYNVAGTKTYRLSSSKNAFGSGGNQQNIPTGDEDEDARIRLPNIKKLFLFDEGYEGFDLDGDSADLRIVTGESGCRAMQAYFAAKVKPYVEIAREFYRDPTITKHHPSYKLMKALCHGSNYGGEAPGLSQRIGLPVHDVSRMQKWYFGMCPEIKRWQDDIREQGEKRGWIENPFGYRLYNWERWSRQVANEFLAWTPQSTVGLLINKIAAAIDEQLPLVELLLQVHDSLNGQYPIEVAEQARKEIISIAESIVIPCKSGPVIVPAGLKVSTRSWGECA